MRSRNAEEETGFSLMLLLRTSFDVITSYEEM